MDRLNHRIRKVDSSGTITTVLGAGGRGFAGDGGTVAEAKFEFPAGVSVDGSGNIFVADRENNRIRKLDVSGVVSTVAGSGPTGSYEGGFFGDGARATEAVIDGPKGIFLDANGNLYIADAGNHRLRRVDATSAVIGTLAGNGEAGYTGDGGLGPEVALNGVSTVWADRVGNIYFADTGNHRIRLVDAVTGIVSTVVGSGRSGLSGDGGLATAARLNAPAGICLDAGGNIYIADTENHRIRKVTTRTGVITTIAGSGSIGATSGGFSGDNGEATTARLNLPGAVFVDGKGGIYLCDTGNNRIRSIDASGRITTVAGTGTTGFEGDGGPAVSARLNKPASIFADDGNSLYISDTGNNRIRKVNESGIISTIAGDGTPGFSGERGPATGASLNAPEGIFGDRAGHLYISDSGNSRVRRVIFVVAPTLLSSGVFIPPSDKIPPEIISSWPVSGARGIDPLFIQGNGVEILFSKIVDTGSVQVGIQTGARTFSWTPSWSQSNTRLTLTPRDENVLDYESEYMITLSGVSDPAGNRSEDQEILFHTKSIFEEEIEGNIVTIAGDGEAGFSGDGEVGGASVRLSAPTDVFVDGDGNLYIADTGNNRVRRIDHATGVITTVVGNGDTEEPVDGLAATEASLNEPSAIVVDTDDNLFIADTENNRIRKVDGQTGEISTVVGDGTGAFSGDGGAATDASIDGPEDVFVDPFGNIYIADKRNGRVRKVDSETGIISTVAGNGSLGYSGDGGPATDAGLYDLRDIFVDRKGQLYIVDGNRVRKVDPATGIINTVAGGAGPGSPLGDGGPATLARLSAETVFVDQRGNMFISDSDRVRKVDGKTGIITTVAGTGELRGFLGDGGPATDASIGAEGIFMDRQGDFFLADKINNRVRKIEGLGEPALSEEEIAGIEGSDFDGDGEVGFGDFVRFATSFGKNLGDSGYSAQFDLDGNGSVSLSDFLRFVSVYGKSF